MSDETRSAGSNQHQRQASNDVSHSNVETPSTAADKLYEPKSTRKIIRVLTVVSYVFFVSLAAILLSVYYVFLWVPQIQAKKTRLEALRDLHGNDTAPNSTLCKC